MVCSELFPQVIMLCSELFVLEPLSRPLKKKMQGISTQIFQIDLRAILFEYIYFEIIQS